MNAPSALGRWLRGTLESQVREASREASREADSLREQAGKRAQRVAPALLEGIEDTEGELEAIEAAGSSNALHSDAYRDAAEHEQNIRDEDEDVALRYMDIDGAKEQAFGDRGAKLLPPHGQALSRAAPG